MKSAKHIASLWQKLALALLLAFTIQIVNNALCYHTHIVDGQLYAHAHPGDNSQSHNEYELNFYSQLQLLDSTEFPALLADYTPIVIREIVVKDENVLLTSDTNILKGRAPPRA